MTEPEPELEPEVEAEADVQAEDQPCTDDGDRNHCIDEDLD